MLLPQSGPITRPPSPDRLDRALQVNTSLGWLALAALAAVVAGAILWSFLSTAPVKVSAQGMLLSSLGIADVNATGTGRIVAIRARVGDKVRRGDALAEIGQFDTADKLRSKELELVGLRGERQRLEEFQSRVGAAQAQLAHDRKEGLEARVESLRRRIDSLLDMERNTRSLVEKGVIVQARLLETVNERTRAQDDYAQTRNSLIQLVAERETQKAQNEREILAIDMKIAAAEREAEVLKGLLSRATTVQAPTDGTIVEAAFGLNDLVQTGMAIMRMLPAGSSNSLLAMVYVSGAEGKRVRPGMAVQIVPANARLQRDGYMEARVVEVSNLPATRESMQRVLKNEGLVQQLTAKGPPFEVVVALARDPASPTGFRWSMGQGLPSPPESGTIAEAKIVVDRIPVIALAVPRAETVLVWLRSLAS